MQSHKIYFQPHWFFHQEPHQVTLNADSNVGMTNYYLSIFRKLRHLVHSIPKLTSPGKIVDNKEEREENERLLFRFILH